MSVPARARSFSRRASAAERYQAKGSLGTSWSARSISLRAAAGIAERDLGAGAVEMDLAAQLVGEVGGQQGGVERGQRPRAVARRRARHCRPGPRNRRGARSFARFGLARRLLEGGRRRRPALERGESEAEALARGEAAALLAPGIGGGDRAFGIGADPASVQAR